VNTQDSYVTGSEPGRARSARPAFTRPIQPNATEIDIGKVPFLPRSELACWWSIFSLIRQASPDVWFWTFTSPYALPLWWFGQRHRLLVAHVNNYAQRQITSSPGGTIPRNWGGVRVFETNPKGTGFHSHWVIRGRCCWYLMQRAAVAAGLGKVVWVDPKPATAKTAWYLATYLTKEKTMVGARKWANIGTWDGIGKRDIIMDSQRIRDIKAWRAYYLSTGKHGYVAYRLAVEAVNAGQSAPGQVPF